MGREEMARDPRYDTGAKRVENREEVDAVVSEWTGSFEMKEVVRLLDAQEVPVSGINSIADIFEDPHFQARGSIIEVVDAVLGTTKMPGIVPRLSRTPGRVERLAPALGEHNDEVYSGLLGFSSEKLVELKEEGVI
jgi:crotonobetainyl-CoA:carnitine CoA-transferase CaiB-like acyl-CoA transferase